jgi:hypothetical protein
MVFNWKKLQQVLACGWVCCSNTVFYYSEIFCQLVRYCNFGVAYDEMQAEISEK